MRQYIPVDVDNLPVIFDITLAGEVYTFRIDYNKVADYYTATIYQDDQVLLMQEPLVLGNLVGFDLPDERLPRTDIRVMDEAGNSADAGEGVLGVQVQLYLDVVDPNGSETTNPSATPLGYDPDNPDDADDTDEEVSY